MKIGKKLLFAAFILTLLAGCAHTSTLQWDKPAEGQVSSEGNRVLWNLTAVNRGMYLFNVIPLWSGYPTRPNRHEYKLAQNMLTRAQMRRMMDVHLDKWGADRVEDVETAISSSGAFSLWIVWRRTMTATGVAVKVKQDSKKISDAAVK
ncbi:MAG: hypothetical protein IKC82_00065 [Lentisphaeria bacterium]|nr:hypothetical protein [Lentisphaeria bacterium]